jgi:hypothetical protein
VTDREVVGGSRVQGEDAGDLASCTDAMDRWAITDLEVEENGVP